MITSILENIVENMDSRESSFSFGFGDKYFNNLINDEGVFPSVWLNKPIDNDYQLIQSGAINEPYELEILFMYKSEIDYTPSQHEEFCIDPANDAIRNFISLCQRSEVVSTIEGAKGTEFTNILNANVSGKSLTVTINPVINKSTCSAISIPFCKPATILDSDGVTEFEVVSNGRGTCTPVSLVNVSNSNDSFNLDTLVSVDLPNIDFTDSDGVTTSIPSMENVIANPCEVKAGIKYNRPGSTFQTTSYRDGDDYWQEQNNPFNDDPVSPLYVQELVDNWTLMHNNEFGNKIRLTDQAGNSAMNIDPATSSDFLTNDTVIDHYTGLEWAFKSIQYGNNKNWNTAIDECMSLDTMGFSDWYLPNIREMESLFMLYRAGLSYMFPLLIGTRNMWSSTTYFKTTTNSIYYSAGSNGLLTAGKTATINYAPVRKRY